MAGAPVVGRRVVVPRRRTSRSGTFACDDLFAAARDLGLGLLMSENDWGDGGGYDVCACAAPKRDGLVTCI